LRELLAHYEVESYLEKNRTFKEVVASGDRTLTLLVAPLSSGFQNPKEGWVLLTEEEIFGERRRLRKESKKGRLPQSPSANFGRTISSSMLTMASESTGDSDTSSSEVCRTTSFS